MTDVCSRVWAVSVVYIYTTGLSSVACQEAMELYSEQMKLQDERKPLPKQDSKAYTKIKVTDIMWTFVHMLFMLNICVCRGDMYTLAVLLLAS